MAAAGVVVLEFAPGLGVFGDCVHANAEFLGDEYAVDIEGTAVAVPAADGKGEFILGFIKFRLLGRGVDDTAAGTETEKDGIRPAGLVDTLDVVEVRGCFPLEEVAGVAGGEAAYAELPLVGPDERVAVDVAGGVADVRHGVVLKEDDVFHVRCADVLEEFRREDGDGGSRVH